jgi:hypothetical protein
VTPALQVTLIVFVSTVFVSGWILTSWMRFSRSKQKTIKNTAKSSHQYIDHPEIIDVEVEVLTPQHNNYNHYTLKKYRR